MWAGTAQVVHKVSHSAHCFPFLVGVLPYWKYRDQDGRDVQWYPVVRAWKPEVNRTSGDPIVGGNRRLSSYTMYSLTPFGLLLMPLFHATPHSVQLLIAVW